MNKKIITLIGAALIASSVHANHQLDQGLRDGIVGGIIGAIIGNNTGSGDSETGALIGAVSGISSGVLNRRSHSSVSHTSVSHSRGHRIHTRSVHHGHHIPHHPVYTTVYEQVWVRPVYNYDFHGNPFVVSPGYYKTITRRVRVR